jgi:uncharacterized protein (DUF1499 family)
MSAEPAPSRTAKTSVAVLRLFGILILIAGGWTIVTGISPARLGVVNGRLQPCPESPNCVCSFDSDSEHAVLPLQFADSPDRALQRLRKIVSAMPRARIRVDEPGYLHAEFRSLVLRFVDDVEFLLDSDAGVIHVRSASRLGYSDLGVNRRRVEAIRNEFEVRR